MAKFYIQSGNVSFVVTANDAEGAALWAMHQTIERMIEINEEMDEFYLNHSCELDGEQNESDREFQIYSSMLDGLAQFAETIKCSQRGFGRDDAGELDTDEVFRHWNQLMRAADRLFDRLN